MLISCKVSKNNGCFENVIGDTVFTSGLGGVFFKDIQIGAISGINPLSIDEIEVVITLKANPLEETFYGVMKKVPDEI
jgi:cell shape-determining protein MreC